MSSVIEHLPLSPFLDLEIDLYFIKTAPKVNKYFLVA